MKNRVHTFNLNFNLRELASALVVAGCPEATTLQDILADRVEDVDHTAELEVMLETDEMLEVIGDEAILEAAADIDNGGAFERAIEDGLRYVRKGELGLANAMFERVFEGGDLRAVQRALS